MTLIIIKIVAILICLFLGSSFVTNTFKAAENNQWPSFIMSLILSIMYIAGIVMIVNM